MWEIDVETMRWRVGALVHKADVTEGASVRDWFERGRWDGIEFTCFGFVDQIEKPRKTIAQRIAKSAAMTHIENASSLIFQHLFVKIVWVFPSDRVPERLGSNLKRVGQNKSDYGFQCNAMDIP
jgi:hypothetical protein